MICRRVRGEGWVRVGERVWAGRTARVPFWDGVMALLERGCERGLGGGC